MCLKGTYFISTSESCGKCSAGTYQESAVNTKGKIGVQCIDCPSGWNQANPESSECVTPLQKNYNRSSNNWKTPVTSRQRRWVNRPATNALDSKVFGVYPLSDVEHMCRVIYKYLTGQGPTTIMTPIASNAILDILLTNQPKLFAKIASQEHTQTNHQQRLVPNVPQLHLKINHVQSNVVLVNRNTKELQSFL